jgi:hypothetical protein
LERYPNVSAVFEGFTSAARSRWRGRRTLGKSVNVIGGGAAFAGGQDERI